MKQEEKTELTKQKILSAAMKEFGVKGYFGASLNNICAAGIPKGLLYHNFENKDALYIACVQNCFTRLTEALEESRIGSDMRRYMEARVTFFKEHEAEEHLFFEAVLDPPPHLQEDIAKVKKAFDIFNRSLYRQILSSFTLREGVTEQDAMAYFTLIQNTFNLYFRGTPFGSLPISQRVEAHEAMLSKLLDFMLYGIAKGGELK